MFAISLRFASVFSFLRAASGYGRPSGSRSSPRQAVSVATGLSTACGRDLPRDRANDRRAAISLKANHSSNLIIAMPYIAGMPEDSDEDRKGSEIGRPADTGIISPRQRAALILGCS